MKNFTTPSNLRLEITENYAELIFYTFRDAIATTILVIYRLLLSMLLRSYLLLHEHTLY